jgi:uncharacterized protein (DUF1330 family)
MIELTPTALDAASDALAGEKPIQMVNLLRYRERADYGVQTQFPPCSGREAYFQRYIAAFSQVAGADKTKIIWVGNVQATLVAADGETWDDIAIVEYESVETMRSILDSAQYKSEAAPHRRAALQDWRFIATTKAELPG